MALAAGAQTFRLVVPAVQAMSGDSQVAVRMRFIGERGEFELGEFPLRVPNPAERALLICVGEALEGGEPNPNVIATTQALRIERFDPERMPRTALSLATAAAFVQIEDFPAHPLGYCEYDLVFLPEDAFSLLRPRQLDSLKSWVEAGGSLCVIPGRGLRDDQLRFLNDLAVQPGEPSQRFELTAEGSVGYAGGRPASGIDLYRSELGRTAVILSPVNVKEDMDTPSWRRMVAFLWKLRFSHTNSVVRAGAWNTGPSEDPRIPSGGDSWTAGQFSPQHNPASDSLAQILMPRSVRLIPLGLIALMLCGFLAVIGPLDYFLLGALKRRKYTWVLLPAACFGFTIAMVALSSHFMGRLDQRTALVICDVGKGGRVLRTNRCELIFAARQATRETRLANALFGDLTHNPSFSESAAGYNYRSPASGTEDGWHILTYRGSVPSAYSVTQEVLQWRPQLNRACSIEAGKSVADFHWDAVTPAMLRDKPRWPEAATSLMGGRPFKGSVVICHGYEIFSSLADPNLLISADPSGDFFPQTGSTSPEAGHLPMPPAGSVEQLIQFTSACPQFGLFSVLSQVSPTGGNNIEDFALLDPTDPNSWLLAVISQTEDGIVVYRRLYWDR
ncbi:MAG: hypothetical protein ABSA67_07930 [Candidatus Brocadiia bacterium]